MKRDLFIALIVIALIAAICFGLAEARPPFKPKTSHPIELELSEGKTPADHVIMRVNGASVTEAEFQAAFHALPEDVQRQFSNAPGKQAFAEQYVRLKLLAQEGEKMGLEHDARVKSVLNAERTNVLANVALTKIVKTPTDEASRRWYSQHLAQFEHVDLNHIVVAYQGSAIPPREGHPMLPEAAAAQKAAQISLKARSGGDFAALAREFSDDTNSAENGGRLGPIGRGVLPPEIEQQVFRLQPGQVSGPIPSRFGIHVFKLGARVTEPFERVRDVVAKQLQQENAYDRVERLRDTAKVDFDPKFFPDAKTWGKSAGSKNPS